MKRTKIRRAAAPPVDSDELSVARRSSGILARHREKTGRITFQLLEGRTKESVVLPAAAARLLKEILACLAEGKSVSIVPEQVELSTQQAADLLNVSRPYFIGMLEGGKIPSRKVGTHRRVHARDVLVYKQAIEAERARALDALAEQAQHLKLGY